MVERVCPHGAVQTELYVLESCPVTSGIRTSYNVTFWMQLINSEAQFPIEEIVFKVLAYLE